jgi:hypothetical protein
MVNTKELYSANSAEIVKTNSKLSGANSGSAKTALNPTKTSPVRSALKEDDFQSLLARLHAEVLSSLLSLSVSRSGNSVLPALSSDDVAMVVAALLAFSHKPASVAGGSGTERKDKSDRDAVGRNGGNGGGGSRMEESVERFAQFLQISMSTKILQLKPGTRLVCITDSLFHFLYFLPQRT